ncbi:COG2199 FOG GGDEF domain [Vibrio sp. B1REV9]|uniref:sensor domain-containing diguanylate cyclase n=1 Tax=Vibrio sp. B1REV9 TaxID=2751179 RepID=UPI001AF169A1|nr:GGDEF domain-containing protein [Vibrio sp. B1REV9]CAE6924175.1 COG2199 FOG GGDEF domain [Vibrio sp. B1REV9]
MLFVSHLFLVLSIILGMSFARYQSEWEMRIEHAAAITKSHLAAQMTFFSSSIAGRNYANLMMPSTKEDLRAIDKLLFLEISGVSDYTKKTVSVRYLSQDHQVWRTDVSDQEVNELKQRKALLEQMLSKTGAEDALKQKKLGYLINKTSIDLDALISSQKLSATTELPWNKASLGQLDYFYDSLHSVLHVCVPLRNINGGYIWVVLDASDLDAFKLQLIRELVYEAIIAALISMVLIYMVTIWIVSPLTRLSLSMKKDIEKIDQTHIPEITRSDEIGDLARAYSSLITKIKNQLRVLRMQTDTDTLTGIGSRFRYNRMGPTLVLNGLQKHKYVCFVLCDIDNFKKFNDTYGHTEGDNALCEVANVFNKHLGESQPAFRLGGEEFALLIYGNTIDEIHNKVQDVRCAVEQMAIPHVKNEPSGVVTISVGAVPMTTLDNFITLEACQTGLEQAFEDADKNLYVAKDKGRNIVIMADTLNIN